MIAVSASVVLLLLAIVVAVFYALFMSRHHANKFLVEACFLDTTSAEIKLRLKLFLRKTTDTLRSIQMRLCYNMKYNLNPTLKSLNSQVIKLKGGI